MLPPTTASENEPGPVTPSDWPANKWLRLGLVLAGIILGQVILYGPALVGKKILLPLDILAQPQVCLPTIPGAPKVVMQDPVVSDMVFFMEPARRFANAELQAGRFPMWTPYQYAGAPFVFPKFSPFKLLEFCTASPVILAWSQLMVALVAGLGAYCFFRRALGVSFWAAVIPTWGYPLTGFFIFWQGYTTCGAVYWLPWALLAVDETVRRHSLKALVGLSVSTCLVLVSGHLDVAGQVLLVAGIYSLWCIWDENRRTWFQARARRTVLALAGGWCLGFLLAAPYLLPLLEYAQSGARMVQRSAGKEERPPVGLAALPQVVLPDVYGSTSYGSLPMFPANIGNLPESTAATYVGVLATLLFAPLAWCSRRHRSINAFLAFLAVWGLSWSLDLPGFVDVLRLPGLNMMSHNRLVFGTAFAFLALAAVGLEAIRERKVSWRWWFWLPLGLLTGLCVWNAWRSTHLPNHLSAGLESVIRAGKSLAWVHDLADVRRVQDSFIQHYRQAALLCGVAAAAWIFSGWRKSWARAAIFATVLMLGDLLWFAYGRNPQQNPALYFPHLPVLEAITKAGPGRVLGVSCLPASLAQIYGLRDIRGYDSVDPAPLMELLMLVVDNQFVPFDYAQTQWYLPKIDGPTPDRQLVIPSILGMLGVRYLIFRGAPPETVRADFQAEDYWAVINPATLPRAYIPRRVTTVADGNNRLALLQAADFDPRAVAYVESAVILPAECRGTAQIAAEIPTRIKVTAQMETAGLIVLADLWDKGWHAYLDGQAVPILRANHALRGVVVPAGIVSVEFRYEPASFAWGLRLAAFAAVILLLLAGWTKWKKPARLATA